MTTRPLILVPALLFALTGCNDGVDAGGEPLQGGPAQVQGEVGCLGDCESEATAEPKPAEVAGIDRVDPKGAYGMGLTLTEFTAISTILADPQSFLDQKVLVRGEAVAVCTKMGCWVELKGDEPYQSLKVKVEDGEIVFPASCQGHEIVVEGVVQRLEYPVETHRKYLAAQAEQKGEAFDPETVTEPLVVWQLRGLGARIDS